MRSVKLQILPSSICCAAPTDNSGPSIDKRTSLLRPVRKHERLFWICFWEGQGTHLATYFKTNSRSEPSVNSTASWGSRSATGCQYQYWSRSSSVTQPDLHECHQFGDMRPGCCRMRILQSVAQNENLELREKQNLSSNQTYMSAVEGTNSSVVPGSWSPGIPGCRLE